MSKTNTFENDLLLLIFNNTDIATIGDAPGLQNSATAGSLYVSLHTSDPGEAGNQTTNEVTTGAYGQYVRQAVARSGAGWTVTGSSVSPTSAINFAQMTTGTGATITHFGVGAESGTTAGKLLYKGAITPNITVANGVTPQLTTATAITED
jgi:hypothetical protein